MKSYRDLPPAIANSNVITLIPWVDKRFDVIGFDPRSAYVEQFWLATLGPATTWFLRHCADLLDHTTCTPLNLEEAAATLGIKHEGGVGSAMVRTVARACRFRTARIVGDSTLSVRRRLPQISKRQLQRLPSPARHQHQEYLSATCNLGVLARHQHRASHLALSLLRCGDTINETERQLAEMRMHPAIVAEAVHWALDNLSNAAGTNNTSDGIIAGNSITGPDLNASSTDNTSKSISGSSIYNGSEVHQPHAKSEPAKAELVTVG